MDERIQIRIIGRRVYAVVYLANTRTASKMRRLSSKHSRLPFVNGSERMSVKKAIVHGTPYSAAMDLLPSGHPPGAERTDERIGNGIMHCRVYGTMEFHVFRRSNRNNLGGREKQKRNYALLIGLKRNVLRWSKELYRITWV
ncbi:hypothetical protein KM043_007573 [Ampulex compressa]|nr:hypothetical protein KM043_007573 [Ampulex compressa]